MICSTSKKSKKVIAFWLALTMIMSLSACGEKDTDSDKKETNSTVSSSITDSGDSSVDNSDSEQSPEKVAEAFMEALVSADYKAMGDLLNDDYVEFQIEGYSKTTAEERMKEKWEQFKDGKYTYELLATVDLNNEIERYQSDIFSYFEGGFEEENLVYSDAKITECCEVPVKCVIEKDGKQYSYVIRLTLIKTNNDENWSIGWMIKSDF